VNAVLNQLSKRAMLYALIAVTLVLSISRFISDNNDITSSGTLGVTLRFAMPIAMAGLGGLYAERSGTVNIGLEGMMIAGTIFAGWWAWHWNPWIGLLGGLIGGMIFGLLHALATVTFGVNHIVSGFAINILAPGVARFMAGELFAQEPGGSITNSPGNNGRLPTFTMPILSGGDLFGWSSPDVLGWFERRHWLIIGDVAGIVRGLTRAVSLDVIFGIGLIVLGWLIIWHTPFGLRLRSAGEKPQAPDSLGVSVARIRYAGMALSGAMAGFGGAILVMFVNRYQENQTQGKGYLGLATLVSGNYTTSGIGIFSGLFGYTTGVTIRNRPSELVADLIWAAAIAFALVAVLSIMRNSYLPMALLLALTAIAVYGALSVKEPNNQVLYVFPYVVTLVVVAVRGGNLRAPAAAGVPYFKGQQ
jgi:simple sugar transport system permease protein